MSAVGISSSPFPIRCSTFRIPHSNSTFDVGRSTFDVPNPPFRTLAAPSRPVEALAKTEVPWFGTTAGPPSPFPIRSSTFIIFQHLLCTPVFHSPNHPIHPALCSLFQQSKIRNLYPVKSPQSGVRIAKFNRAGPKSNTPSFFSTFWGFFSRLRQYKVNLHAMAPFCYAIWVTPENL